MLSPSQLCSVCFAVFVANFTFSQVEGNSFAVLPHSNTILTLDSGFSDDTRCIWNCTIIDSTLPEHRNSVLTKSSRLIKLVVEYKKNVTKQCVNQAFNNSSGNATESYIVWSPGNNRLSSIHRVIQHWFELIPCPDTTVHIKAVCRFLRDLGTRSEEVNSTFNNSIMNAFVRSHLKDHGFEVRTSTEISQNSIESHFTTAHIWLHTGVKHFVFLFCYTIVLYFPAFLCLFSPTLVHENGLGQIIVEGASPVSFRSLVGNYFFSERDSIGHRVGKVILRLMVLPFTLITLAVIPLYYDPQHQNLPYLLKPLERVCVAFYLILFTYNSFCKTSHQAKTCICQLLEKSNIMIVHDVEVPRRIQTNLRIQPLVLKTWWSFLCTRFICFFKMSRCILPSRKVSLLWFFRVGGLLVFLFIIPAVTFMFLTAMLVATLFCVVVTSPVMVLLGDEIVHIHVIFYRLPFPLIVLINLAATVGFACVLSSAALGLTKIVGVTLIHLLSEESLPFNTLLALICYYLWNSYSHFTNKYHDLSKMLYKCYQKHRPEEISDETAVASTADSVQAENKPIPESKCNEIKIPQQLFDMACEKLMPIRDSVWKLILEIMLILFLFFMAFALTSLFTDSVTYVMKSLVTFLSGLLTKIVAIFMIDRAMIMEEKVQRIVQRYITGTASAEQDQDSFVTNTEELTIHVDNEAGVVENSPM